MGARQDEFERMAMPHVSSLLRVARRLSRDRAAAEDLVQETMLRAWRGLGQFREGTNARAWLFRILFHQFYSQGRKLRSEMQAVAPSAPSLHRGSSVLDAVELNDALAALTPEHRAVLLLAVVEGFTCQEIAEILAIPIGTVMSRLSRARQALRERLAGVPCAKGGRFMNCAEMAALAPLYLSGELDAARTSAVNAHLQICAACARDVEQQRELDARLRGALLAEDPGTNVLVPGIRRRIAVARAKRRVLTLALTAASVVLAPGVLLYRFRRWPPVRALTDAAQDHRREVVDRQVRKWRRRREIEALAQRQGLPSNAIPALAAAGYRLAIRN